MKDGKFMQWKSGEIQETLFVKSTQVWKILGKVGEVEKLHLTSSPEIFEFLGFSSLGRFGFYVLYHFSVLFPLFLENTALLLKEEAIYFCLEL